MTTCVAVMSDPLVHPSTRTGSLFVRALAELELVPFWYVVKAPSVMVTFWSPDVVVIVKLAVDTLLTVPAAPPGAGPDRALDPSLLDPEQLPELLAEALAEGLAEPLAEGLAELLAEGLAELLAELRSFAAAEGDVARPTESPTTAHVSAAATIHPLLLFDSNRRPLGRRACSSGELVGSFSLMMALLLLRQLGRNCQPLPKLPAIDVRPHRRLVATPEPFCPLVPCSPSALTPAPSAALRGVSHDACACGRGHRR